VRLRNTAHLPTRDKHLSALHTGLLLTSLSRCTSRLYCSSSWSPYAARRSRSIPMAVLADLVQPLGLGLDQDVLERATSDHFVLTNVPPCSPCLLMSCSNDCFLLSLLLTSLSALSCVNTRSNRVLPCILKLACIGNANFVLEDGLSRVCSMYALRFAPPKSLIFFD